jgi:hypothetical protein
MKMQGGVRVVVTSWGSESEFPRGVAPKQRVGSGG